jgi:hypothetical protein
VRVRRGYRFVESLTLLSQRLNARGGRGRRYGVGGRGGGKVSEGGVEVWGRREGWRYGVGGRGGGFMKLMK